MRRFALESQGYLVISIRDQRFVWQEPLAGEIPVIQRLRHVDGYETRSRFVGINAAPARLEIAHSLVLSFRNAPDDQGGKPYLNYSSLARTRSNAEIAAQHHQPWHELAFFASLAETGTGSRGGQLCRYPASVMNLSISFRDVKIIIGLASDQDKIVRKSFPRVDVLFRGEADLNCNKNPSIIGDWFDVTGDRAERAGGVWSSVNGLCDRD